MTRQNQSLDEHSHLLSTGRRSKKCMFMCHVSFSPTLVLIPPSNTEPNAGDVDPENKYIRFGKQVHRKYLGFGTIGSALFARRLIDETLVQAANEDTSTRSLFCLKKAVEKHRCSTFSLPSKNPADTPVTQRRGHHPVPPHGKRSHQNYVHISRNQTRLCPGSRWH